MSYSTDHFAIALKNAREAKGLSQRALSELVGVPQSHISKIESGGVDVRVSSLVELARVLDLELTLVPRKSVPAVDSIIRSTSGASPQPSSATRKAWKNVQDKLNRISHADPTNIEFAQVQRLARDLEHLGFAVVDRQTLRDVNKRVDAILERRDANGVHRLLVEFKRMRNAVAHDAGGLATTTKVRPAYSLEESSDGE